MLRQLGASTPRASVSAPTGTGTPSTPMVHPHRQVQCLTPQQPGSVVLGSTPRLSVANEWCSAVSMITRPDVNNAMSAITRSPLVAQPSLGFSMSADPTKQSLSPSLSTGFESPHRPQISFIDSGLSVSQAPLSARSQSSQTSVQTTLCRTFDASGREFQPLVVTSTPVELISSPRGSRVLDSTVGASSIGQPLEDVSGITSEDNTVSNLGQVTFDAGATDPIVFVKGDAHPFSITKEAPVRRIVNAHTVQRENSGVISSPCGNQNSVSSSPHGASKSDLEPSVLGSMHSLIRSIPSRQQSRSSRSASPAASPPPVELGGARSIIVDADAVVAVDGGGAHGIAVQSLEGQLLPADAPPPLDNYVEGQPCAISPGNNHDQPLSPIDSKWATAEALHKQKWLPAMSSPTLFCNLKERHRSTSRAGSNTPPRSACSTPRRQRSGSRQRGECYQDLYADAAERSKRRTARKEAKDADSENQLRASRESSLRATRRYRSSDKRNVLQRSEDHLRRKADLQDLAERNRRVREEQEMQECTFRPALHQRSCSGRRVQDEREMERHLRQLAHKQLDVRARLVQLEREWARVHRQRKALISERCKGMQNDRKHEVFDLLNTKEGQEYYWERVQRLSEVGSTTSKVAQNRVLHELLEDQRHIIEQQVADEVDAELQLAGRNLDFWARRNVLLESLEAMEARAAPTLRMLADMPEGNIILKESGFSQGLAQQMRDDLPDTNGAISREPSAERASAAGASAAGVSAAGVSAAGMSMSDAAGSSPRVIRSLSMHSPVGGTSVISATSGLAPSAVQVTTTTDMEPPSRIASSLTSVSLSVPKGSPPTSMMALQPGSTPLTVRPVGSVPTRLVSSPQLLTAPGGQPLMATMRPMTTAQPVHAPVAALPQTWRVQSMRS